jgi:urease accessory protein
MIIREKIGNLQAIDVADRVIDTIPIEWHQVNKRIWHKRTMGGKEVACKFLNASPNLQEGDVLWMDDSTMITVTIQPCEAIVFAPADSVQLAAICYEIGNRHLPLFYHDDELVVPFEAPLFNLFTAAGYSPKKEMRKLVNPLKTTVAPHAIGGTKPTLLSRILQLTTTEADGK